jgi:GH35 family endo-1,4-beta-xylanase
VGPGPYRYPMPPTGPLAFQLTFARTFGASLAQAARKPRFQIRRRSIDRRRWSISAARAEITTWGRDEGPGWFQIKAGAVTSAVLVHLRVEPAHFDWRWRERPALALLVWEA